MESNVTWNNNLNFTASFGNHSIIVDAAKEVGGDELGMRPKALMLAALGSCTGMDVISILKKMKIHLDFFNVKVEGLSADEHPKKFLEMKVIYQVRGTNLDYDKIEKAVVLSQEKYCGVKASYEGSIKMSYEIQIL